MSDISLTVLDDMRLMISPAEVGRDSEHNSALFKVTQPPALDQYACRAEVETAAGTTYRLVTNGEFALTNDMTVRGPGRLQLVYSDGVDVIRKSTTASFHVTGSLNAVDESAPGFGDGLAQLQGSCFASADLVGLTINFYNLAGQLVSSVTSTAGGLPEVPEVNGAYARTRSGAVTAWTDFATMRVAGLDSPQFAGSPTLTPTPAPGASNAVLANTEFVARDFLPRAGGQMSGPLIATSGGSLTNMGLAFGDNATGFYRTGNILVIGVSGAFIGQWLTNMMQLNVPLMMGGQRVMSVADATAVDDALNQRTADARYLPRSGGTLTGTLTTVPGTGQNALGLGVGDGNTGFYRNGPGVGADLMLLVVGYPLLMLTAARDVLVNGSLSMALNRITSVGDATADTDALNGRTGDARYGRAQSVVIDLPGNVIFASATFANLMPITFAIPRGGNSRIMVSVVLDCSLPGDSQICITGVRCSSAPATIRSGFLYQLNGACSGVVAQFVFDVAGTSVGPFDVQCANLSTGPGGGAVSWTALAGSQAIVTDLGPR
jgi:hypothetical protein